MSDNLNILKVRVSNTGLKTETDNLQLNQNSANNRLYLYCENKYEFIIVFYTWPDGTTTYKHHMILDGYNEDEDAYIYYDDIDEAITSFVIPNVTGILKVSFLAYYKNQLHQYIPVAINTSSITVTRVNNNEVLDRTYNGTDVPNLWSKLGEITNALSVLDPQDTSDVLVSLQNQITNLSTELNGKIDTIPTTDNYYTKNEIDTKLSSVYKYKGNVPTYSALPITGMAKGDVYNVQDTGINWAWTGTEWDSLGDSLVDLNDYYTKLAVDTKINSLHSKVNTNTTNIGLTDTKLDNHISNYNIKIEEIDDVLADMYRKSDLYTKNEVDSKISGAYKYKGSVLTKDQLPSNKEVGDVWNVVNDNGNNYAWNGEKWDSLGPIVNLNDYYTKDKVDDFLSNVLTKDSAYAKTEIDSKIKIINETTANLTSRIDNTDEYARYLTTTVSNNFTTLDNKISEKQDTLISGVNIKTINGNSILGNGDLTIEVGEETDTSDCVKFEGDQTITGTTILKRTSGGVPLKLSFNSDRNNAFTIEDVSYRSSIFFNIDGALKGDTHLYFPTTDGTLALKSDIPTFKTINGQTITGTGNITIQGGSGGSADTSNCVKFEGDQTITGMTKLVYTEIDSPLELVFDNSENYALLITDQNADHKISFDIDDNLEYDISIHFPITDGTLALTSDVDAVQDMLQDTIDTVYTKDEVDELIDEALGNVGNVRYRNYVGDGTLFGVEKVLRYGFINSIKGNSVTSKNLLGDLSKLADGNYVIYSNDAFIINANSPDAPPSAIRLSSGDYTLSWRGGARVQIYNSDSGTILAQTPATYTNTSISFNVPSECNIGVKWLADPLPGVVSEIMLNRGTTALPYEPYIDGIKNSTTIDKGSNLANPNLFVNGWYADSGSFTPSDNDKCITEYLSVKPNTTYTLSFDVPNDNQVLWYDINHNLISRHRVINTYNTFTLPSNAYYIRYTFQQIVSQVMLNKGSTALPYEPYVEDSIGDSIAIKTVGGNLLNSSFSVGYYLDQNGQIAKINTSRAANEAYILVKGASKVYVMFNDGNKYSLIYATYDSDRNLMDREAIVLASNKHEIPLDGAAYIRICPYSTRSLSGVDFKCVVSFNQNAKYEPYKESIHELKGKVKRYIGEIDLGDLSVKVNTTYDGLFELTGATFMSRQMSLLCDSYSITEGTSVITEDYSLAISDNGTTIYLHDNSVKSASELKAKLSGVKLIYELATPIEEEYDGVLRGIGDSRDEFIPSNDSEQFRLFNYGAIMTLSDVDLTIDYDYCVNTNENEGE